jgi:hypothetical protein
MLVEQEQDLRKLGEAWRMSIFQKSDEWQVILSKDNEPNGLIPTAMGFANNPKLAFKNAFREAQAYEDSLKKSS